MTCYPIGDSSSQGVLSAINEFLEALDITIAISKDKSILTNNKSTAAQLIAAAQEIHDLMANHPAIHDPVTLKKIELLEQFEKTMFISIPGARGGSVLLKDGSGNNVSLYDFVSASNDANFTMKGQWEGYLNQDSWHGHIPKADGSENFPDPTSWMSQADRDALIASLIADKNGFYTVNSQTITGANGIHLQLNYDSPACHHNGIFSLTASATKSEWAPFASISAGGNMDLSYIDQHTDR
jgi:hypothetical protein